MTEDITNESINISLNYTDIYLNQDVTYICNFQSFIHNPHRLCLVSATNYRVICKLCVFNV